MSQILSNKEIQSKSIYSDACQNSAEIEQIYKNSKILKKYKIQNKDKYKNNKKLDNSKTELYSKEFINEKNDIHIIDLKRENFICEKSSMSLEYKSCYEEKIKEHKKDNINNNINIDKEDKIIDNIENLNLKHFDLSTINSNSNNNSNNFLEENTESDIKKIFKINSDSNNKEEEYKLKKQSKQKSKNNNNKNTNTLYSFYSNYNNLDFSLNDSNEKLNTNNNRTFTSLQTNNKYFFKSNKIKNNNNNIKDNYSNNNNESNINFNTKKEMIINKIKFEGIKKDEIDIDYFNTKFKIIPIKSYNINDKKNKHIKTLYELQDFVSEDSAITVIKIDEEGKYLTLGFKNGIIKLYEIINYFYEKYKLIYNKSNLKEYLNYINKNSFNNLIGHSSEIIDLFWLLSSNNYLLSSSLEEVLLWKINPENSNYIVKKFQHSDTITCLSLNSVFQNMFATGCQDKFIRLYSINKNYLEYPSFNSLDKHNNKSINNNNEDELREFYVNDEIISINFLQEGNKIAIGTNKGKILIYLILPKINFEYKFECKNRSGKPITNINFFSSSTCIISSKDSRIRFVNIKNGKIIHKYKGHKNEKNNIKIGVDLCNDIIISGSENGNCYLWNIYNKENDKIKNYSYEYFKPFSSNDIINVAQIISEKCYVNYFQKILKITNKIIIDSVIINANDKGRIKIIINVNELY